MTKNRKSSLFSNHSSRRSEKRAPRGTSLRIEALENRELLSVNAADYAQLRETFDQLALPENFSDVNVIELPALTAEALQNAINDAATTPQDDLIVVDPTELGENTLSLADATIVVDFDASEFGAVTLVSTGDERLQISVNPADYSFDFRSGVLNFAGLDFVDVVDSALLCTIDVEALDAGRVDSVEQDARYYDGDGLELVGEMIGGYFLVDNDVESTLELSESQQQLNADYSNSYVILFIGTVKGKTESVENKDKQEAWNKTKGTWVDDVCSFTDIKNLYNSFTKIGIPGNNIYVLYANATTGMNNGKFPFANEVEAATKTNLRNKLMWLGEKKMTPDANLFVYIGDHGGDGEWVNDENGKSVWVNSLNMPDKHEEFFGTSTEDCVGQDEFKSYLLSNIRSGNVTIAMGTCFGGGILDYIFDPATGRLNPSYYDDKTGKTTSYTGQAHFSGAAASNHMEYSIFSSDHNDANGSFGSAISKAFDEGCRTFNDVFKYVEENYIYSTKKTRKDTDYPNNGQTEYADYKKSDGKNDQCHPWHHLAEGLPSDQDIFKPRTSFGLYDPNFNYAGVSTVQNAELGPIQEAAAPGFSFVYTQQSLVTDNSVTFSWSGCAGANGYEVIYREEGASRWSAPIYVSGRQCTITGLQQHTKYQISIRGVYKYWGLFNYRYKYSAYLESFSVTTKYKLADPVISVAERSDKSIKIEWKPKWNNYLSLSENQENWAQTKYYRVECKTEAGKTVGVKNVSAPCRKKTETMGGNYSGTDYQVGVYECTFDGLEDGVKYTFSVQAIGDPAVSVNSNVKSVTARTLIKLLPPSLSLSSKSNDLVSGVTRGEGTVRDLFKAELERNKDSYITGYKLRYRELSTVDPNNPDDGWIMINMDSPESPSLSSNLYQFQALAKGDGDNTADSDWSNIFFTDIALRRIVGTNSSDATVATSLPNLVKESNDSPGQTSAYIIFDESMKGKTIELPSTFTINKSIIIDASSCMNEDGTPGVTIDAMGMRAFYFGSNATNVVLNGLRIINASTTGDGGAIFSDAQNLTVTNCAFEDNHVEGDGGAIYSKGQNLTVTNCVFEDNNAEENGGAIYSKGQNLTVTNCVFENNSAYLDEHYEIYYQYGGAIYSAGQNLTVTNSVFRNNAATYGGAIYQLGGTVSIDSSKFTGNSASNYYEILDTWEEEWEDEDGEIHTEYYSASIPEYYGSGGALYLNGGATFVTTSVTNTDFYDNVAEEYGGALYVKTGSLTTQFTSFYDNSAIYRGGAIYSSGASVTADTGVFYGNSAYLCGGAMYLDGSQCSVVNALVYGNDASQGAFDVRSGSSLFLGYSTIVDNRGSAAISVGSSSSVDVANSILLPSATQKDGVFYNYGSGSTVTGNHVLSTTPSEWDSTTNFYTYDPSKPLFTDAANGDYTLAADSQAFNRGMDLRTLGNYTTPIDAQRDLAGAPRQVGGRVDLGAYEYQTYEPRTWTVTTTSDVLGAPGSLRYAVNHAHEGDVILFDEALKGKTIALNGSELLIEEGITIDASNLYDEENDRPGLTISGNYSSRVFNIAASAGDVTMIGLTIANGSAADGGGIYKGVNSSLELDRCFVENNFAETGSGGGVYAGSGELKIVDSTFRANRTLSTVGVNSSQALEGMGAGVFLSSCNTTIVSSTFVGNKSSMDGGAIFAYRSRVDVESSTFTQNTTFRQSSAIEWYYDSSGSVRNSLFYGNTGGHGVVLYLDSRGAANGVEVTIENTTIANNSTSGAYYASPAVSLYTGETTQPGTYHIRNSIIAFNSGVQYGAHASEVTPKGAQTFDVRNTLVTQNVGATNGNISYTGEIDALFMDAAHDDYSLALHSPAINAGSNDGVTIEADLAGDSRIVAGRIDLGAYEWQGREICVGTVEAFIEAIEGACHGDYIYFDEAMLGKEIRLTEPLTITQAITIDATNFMTDPFVYEGIDDEEDEEEETPDNALGASLVVSGAYVSQGHALAVDAPGQQVFIKGLTFADARDGALLHSSGELTLESCSFVDNTGQNGGAIYNNATLTLVDSSLTGNKSKFGGGAIYNAGTTLTITNSTISGNVSNALGNGDDTTAHGGAIYAAPGSTITIAGSEITDNESRADSSGAIYNNRGTLTITDTKLLRNKSGEVGGAIENHLGTVAITGSELSYNRALDGVVGGLTLGGGAIYNNGGSLKLNSTRVVGNESNNYYGGGIYSLDAQELTIVDCDFEDNTAGVLNGGYVTTFTPNTDTYNYGGGRGGAIFVHSRHTTRGEISGATIVNTIIANNNACSGGGIYLQNAWLNLYNSDVVCNTAREDGGGIVVDYGAISRLTDTVDKTTVNGVQSPKVYAGRYSVFNSYNSIIALNTTVVGQRRNYDVYVGAETPYASFGDGGANLVSHYTLTNSRNWTREASSWSDPNRIIQYDPQFPLFADAEGRDFTLAVDSQALNKGSVLHAYPDLDVDRAGGARIVGGRVDLGAFESQSIQSKTWTVTCYDHYDENGDFVSGDDEDDPNSLRYIVNHASYGDTIVFAPALKGKTITLQSTLGALRIEQSITIDASALYDAVNGQPGVTVHGNGDSVIEIVEDPSDALDVAISGLTITGGYAGPEAAGGGGIVCHGVRLTLDNCSIVGNTAYGQGGGILAYAGSRVVINNTKINDNSAGTGGALYSSATRVIGSSSDTTGSVTLNGCQIRSNHASETGGAISCELGANVDLNSCTVENNVSDGRGGGVDVWRGSLTAVNTRFSGNSAQYGGGVANVSGNVYFYNVAVVGNSAQWNGGGLSFTATKQLPAVMELYNSIVFGNTLRTVSSAYAGSEDVMLNNEGSNSFIKANNTLSSSLGYWQNSGSSDNLVMHQGEVLYNDSWKLRSGSPAIDSGSTAYVKTDVDFFGNVRVYGDSVDLGPSEYMPRVVPPTLSEMTVTGETAVGETLTASFTSGFAPAATFQWSWATSAAEDAVWKAIPGATEQSYSPTDNYVNRYLKVTATGARGFTGVQEFIVPSVVSTQLPSAEITFSALGPDVAKILWAPVAHASKYAIAYKEAQSDEWTVKTYSRTSTSLISEDGLVGYLLTGLEPSTRYDVKVQVVGNGKSYFDSEYSSVESATTYDDSLIIDRISGDYQVGGTVVAETMREEVDATWQWYRAVENVSGGWEEVVGATGRTYTTSQEDLGKRLMVVAQATGSDGYRGEAIEVGYAVWTRLDAPELSVAGKTTSALTLEWRSDDNASGYTIELLSEDGDEYYLSPNLDCDATSYTFENLTFGKSYEVRIVARGDGEAYLDSEYSSPKTVVMDPSISDSAFVVTAYDAETRVATIEWGAVSGASKYTVKISKDGGDTWSNYKTNVTTTSLSVNGLYTGKAYAFRVSGVASDGTAVGGVKEVAFAPVSATSSVQDYTVGTPITLKLSAASNATATIQWYFVTSEGDVEIVSARNQLSYTPTTADYDIKVVTTGTGDSAPCVYTQTIARPIDAAPITVRSYDAETRIATIRWDPMPGAATYTVKISRDGGATWVDYIKKIPSKNNYKGINGIYAGRSYDFRVYGITSDGTAIERYAAGTVAPIALSSTTTSYSVGKAITARQTGAENASATIKWYSVTPTKDVEIVSARNQLTYTPTTADYDIKVVATGTGDSKGCNSTLTFTAPAAISVTSYDASTRVATLGWQPIAGATKYTVKLSKNDGATWTNYKTNLTTTSTTVNGLYVGKTYMFQVYGYEAGVQVGDCLELTFTPTSDSSALIDEYFADFFEEELFEEVF